MKYEVAGHDNFVQLAREVDGVGKNGPHAVVDSEQNDACSEVGIVRKAFPSPSQFRPFAVALTPSATRD